MDPRPPFSDPGNEALLRQAARSGRCGADPGREGEDPAPVPPARSNGGKLLPDSLCLRLSGESGAPATAIDVERN
ncbi:hypothetical protein NL676_029294 [Syzygium grande]|nr:hypothetical protein NL676_029294 [Syzygium grande]